jgi:hypothetical protein
LLPLSGGTQQSSKMMWLLWTFDIRPRAGARSSGPFP